MGQGDRPPSTYSGMELQRRGRGASGETPTEAGDGLLSPTPSTNLSPRASPPPPWTCLNFPSEATDQLCAAKGLRGAKSRCEGEGIRAWTRRPKWMKNRSAGGWEGAGPRAPPAPAPGQGRPWAPRVPTGRGGGAARGRHCASGSRVAGPGGPALPAVPEIVPPARATRARSAPAGRTWCGGARRRRRRRLPESGAAGHQHPTPARPLARRLQEAPAVPAQREPRAHLTSHPCPRALPPPGPEAGPTHAHRPPRLRPRVPRARWGAAVGLQVLPRSVASPLGVPLRLQHFSLRVGAKELVRQPLKSLFY